jgi:hypothetical protein
MPDGRVLGGGGMGGGIGETLGGPGGGGLMKGLGGGPCTGRACVQYVYQQEHTKSYSSSLV